jgi:hypothetical protein
MRKANEIDHIRTDRRLAAKFPAVNLLRAQQPPKALFSLRHEVSETAREVALLSVAVHSVVFTPSPTPTRKGEVAGNFLEYGFRKGEGAGRFLELGSGQLMRWSFG